MGLSTSPTLITECVDDVCRSLVHSHGPVRTVLTVMMGLSVHATVRVSVPMCERACPVRSQHVHSSEMSSEMGVGLETRRSCDQ